MRLVEVIQEMGIESRPWSDEEIVAGAPCTYYIGSDSYGETVDKVVRYKSGPRKGRVKEIHIREENWQGPTVFRPAERSDGRLVYLLVSEGRKQWYGQLVVGFQRDYRDPHF